MFNDTLVNHTHQDSRPQFASYELQVRLCKSLKMSVWPWHVYIGSPLTLIHSRELDVCLMLITHVPPYQDLTTTICVL